MLRHPGPGGGAKQRNPSLSKMAPVSPIKLKLVAITMPKATYSVRQPYCGPPCNWRQHQWPQPKPKFGPISSHHPDISPHRARYNVEGVALIHSTSDTMGRGGASPPSQPAIPHPLSLCLSAEPGSRPIPRPRVRCPTPAKRGASLRYTAFSPTTPGSFSPIQPRKILFPGKGTGGRGREKEGLTCRKGGMR
jgi:hypothetical protein